MATETEQLQQVDLEVAVDPNAEAGSRSVNENLIDSITSKEINDTKPPETCSCFAELRWKINLCGLHHPCSCASKFAFITVSDIIIFIIFLLWIVGLLLADISKTNSGVTSKLETLHGVAVACGRGAVRNFGVTMLLSQRNTIFRHIFGLPFERAIPYHMFLARMGLIHIWAHFILLIIYYSSKNGVSVADLLGSSPGIFGFIAFLCIFIGAIIAHDPNRRKCFHVFLNSHYIFMPSGLILMIIHVRNELVPLLILLIPVALGVVDAVIKMGIKSKRPVTLKSMQYLQDLNAVKMVWKQKDFTFCGGQYVFMCVPSISGNDFHPFSVSCPADNEDRTLHIKCVGDWVEKLKNIATDKDTDIKELKVVIDGPYGRPCIPHMKYASMILMCGGIGITPMISILDELLNNAKAHKDVITKRVHFVWAVRRPQMIKEFDDILKGIILKHTQYEASVADTKLKEEIDLNGRVVIKVSYYVTNKGIAQDESEQQKWRTIYDNLYFKRSDAKVVIADALESKGSECIGIMGCGPAGMTESMRKEAAVNGIHCHTEIFYF